MFYAFLLLTKKQFQFFSLLILRIYMSKSMVKKKTLLNCVTITLTILLFHIQIYD